MKLTFEDAIDSQDEDFLYQTISSKRKLLIALGIVFLSVDVVLFFYALTFLGEDYKNYVPDQILPFILDLSFPFMPIIDFCLFFYTFQKTSIKTYIRSEGDFLKKLWAWNFIFRFVNLLCLTTSLVILYPNISYREELLKLTISMISIFAYGFYVWLVYTYVNFVNNLKALQDTEAVLEPIKFTYNLE